MKPRDHSCIFCAIVAGHVPCHADYEDEHLLTFLDHRPLNPGYVLVVPKRHEPDFHRLVSELGSVSKVEMAMFTLPVQRHSG